ncbi:hypothetical protein PsorP6_006358 [Peronosclerospora sorghi]|uniref:Uncharacterized protein n=1 Tax=Peronosclerospora sorghi TaxID=230839 RepID=A0ACC0W2C9_9STRA|nr:hypothetical protein PsorP6_006358 [Peronosclerospora sorghi]
MPCTCLKITQVRARVAMKCCEDVANVRCQESVEKPCWNVQSCGAKVTVPGTMAATSRSLIFVKLVKKGIPSDCPECSSSGLDAAIKDSQRILSSKKLHLGAPAAARILPAMDRVTHIDMNPSIIREFLIRKMKLLNRFKESLDSSALWMNPLFRPVEFFVVVLNGKLLAQSIEKFEMKDFGSSYTFNDIEVIEATQANFKRVLRNERVSILFDYVDTVKRLVNPVDLPKTIGKNVRNWVARQLSHGYDAFYREKTQGEVGSWIICPPYAMFPVYRVDVNDTNRSKILQCLPEGTQGQQPPLKIRFTNPHSAETGEELKVVAVAPKPSIMSEGDFEQLRLLVRSVSPLLEKINVWHPWEWKSLSTGAADAIPQRTETTLASKLSFIPSRVANMDITIVGIWWTQVH